MAIPPISNPCPEDQVKQYYEDILSSIQIPLVVQDASGYLGNSMSIELQSDNEDTKTLLSYAEAFIEKHRNDKNG